MVPPPIDVILFLINVFNICRMPFMAYSISEIILVNNFLSSSRDWFYYTKCVKLHEVNTLNITNMKIRCTH